MPLISGRRISCAFCFIGLFLVTSVALPLTVHAQDVVKFNIPAQDLSSALRTFAKAAHQQIVFDSKRVRGLKSAPLNGNYSVDEALHLLLANAGLSLSKTAAGVYYVKEDSDGPLVASGVLVDRDSENNSLEEVVVTAQKKSERLLDVPVPVTVVDAQALAENDQNRIQDFYATVPGLNLDTGTSTPGGGRQYLQIRGVGTTAFSTPTVAVLIDDVAVGGSTNNSGAAQLSPDIDPSDLAHIEVLKGPQGTLYGADSLGGLVKFVTQDPSVTGFSGRIQMLGDAVINGGQGYGVRGAANIPLSDTLALRVSGFSRQDPGYVDNVTTGQNNVNAVEVYGGRASMLWRLSDAASLKVSALFQNSYSDGSPHIDANSSFQPALGDLRQTGLAGVGYNSQLRLYTATLAAKLSNVELTSITGYSSNTSYITWDFSNYYGFSSSSHFEVPGDLTWQRYSTEKFSQEIRLNSPVTDWLSWLGGVFYTHEASPLDNASVSEANTVPNGTDVGTLLSSVEPVTLSEYAIFGDLTFNLTDRFDVQVGGRESWDKQSYFLRVVGVGTPDIYGQPAPYVVPYVQSSGSAFTYLFTPRFKISPDEMVYARIASGYRIGAPNLPPFVPGEPAAVKPDRSTNYEVGFKADTLDHRLTFDASVYYIDWRDIQLNVYIPAANVGYDINGGHAKSEGVELAIQGRPTSWTQVSLTGAYNDAALTQDLPPHASDYGVAGNRLPYSSRFTGSLDVQQDIMHVGETAGFVGASASYVGMRYGEFEPRASIPRFIYPAYTVINARAGVHVASWSVNLFLNNATNRWGIIGGSHDGSFGTAGYFDQIIQPRTLGVSLTKTF